MLRLSFKKCHPKCVQKVHHHHKCTIHRYIVSLASSICLTDIIKLEQTVKATAAEANGGKLLQLSIDWKVRLVAAAQEGRVQQTGMIACKNRQTGGGGGGGDITRRMLIMLITTLSVSVKTIHQ